MTQCSNVDLVPQIMTEPATTAGRGRSKTIGFPVFSDVVVAYGHVLAKLELGSEYDRLAVQPPENHAIRFVVTLDPHPHPFGFFVSLSSDFEFDEVSRLDRGQCLKHTRILTRESGGRYLRSRRIPLVQVVVREDDCIAWAMSC